MVDEDSIWQVEDEDAEPSSRKSPNSHRDHTVIDCHGPLDSVILEDSLVG